MPTQVSSIKGLEVVELLQSARKRANYNCNRESGRWYQRKATEVIIDQFQSDAKGGSNTAPAPQNDTSEDTKSANTMLGNGAHGKSRQFLAKTQTSTVKSAESSGSRSRGNKTGLHSIEAARQVESKQTPT